MIAKEIQSIPASSPAFHPLAVVYVFPTCAQSGDARELNLHIQKRIRRRVKVKDSKHNT